LRQERIHYLDWLKVLIVYGIIVFHVSLVFSAGTWLVSNHDRNLILTAFAGFTFPWGIPAMFLIAGADAWFGLRSRSVSDFIRKRFLRLLVPMVPGLLILSPLQRFISSHDPPPSLDTFWPFYLNFFRELHFEWTLQLVSRYWLHLWFLGYLFVISIVCLPAVLWLRGPAGRRLTETLIKVASRRAGLLMLVAPLAATQLALRWRFPAYQDWADVATYTVVFLWGAVIFSDRRFGALIRDQVRWLLGGGVLAAAGIGVLAVVTPSHVAGDSHAPAAMQAAYALLWSLYVWSWLHAVLYLGLRWLNFPSRAQQYAQESVLPVYVIHHPVVLLVASFVVTWNLGVWPKFAVILVTVVAVTLAIYEFGVRRWAVTRLVFGLYPLPHAEPKAGIGPHLPVTRGLS
jgi:glucans biosynthesis protein C